jgi:predicted phage baseplate assembly protein
MAEGATLCGCGTGISVRTPQASYQRPGLSVILARTGDYWAFLDTMTARLSSADYGTLSDLKTRDASVDFSIALIDAWAVSADILTFYTERLLSETLLPTAGEIWSLHQLAGLVSYRPHPGVSASALLAFTMSETAGSPRRITLPSGVKVQSTPGPDESPVIFETTEPIEARPAWNALRPRQTEIQALTAATSELYLAGTGTGLVAGDGLFYFADDTSPIFALIRRVDLVPADPVNDPGSRDLTRLTIHTVSGAPLSQSVTAPAPAPTPVFPDVLAANLGTTVTAAELTELLAAAAVDEPALFDPLAGAPETPKRILVFRESYGVFGNNAPEVDKLPPTMTGDVPTYGPSPDDPSIPIIIGLTPGPYKGVTADEWADGDLTVLQSGENAVHLDRVSKDITEGSYAVLRQGPNWGAYQIDVVRELAMTAFTINARTTRLVLDSNTGFDTFLTRNTTVFAASEWVDLPRAPRRDAVRAGAIQIDLAAWAPGLQPGQTLALTGIYADGLDAPVARMVDIAEVQHQLFAGGTTQVTLAAALTDDFDRTALRMNANVAPANHGETTQEVLGSGDASTPFLQLVAKQKPLTHVTAAVPGGALAAAELRVGGILWHPVANLLDAAPQDRVYTLTTDPDGIATIGFGNGAMGAMPPAGQGNISLTYRTGLGLAGRVDAGQLNILMTRPLGVQAAINPLPAEGGADPEPLEALRDNVPLSCRTLDRVVSLSDFADFARAFGGIAKARAEWVKFPGAAKAGVAVTVAGVDGQEVLPGSVLYDDLNDALINNGIPYTRFRLKSYRPRFFYMAAKVKPLPDFLTDVVLADVEAALRAAFAFEARSFAAAVFASDVITVMQTVPGVEAVLLDRLYAGGDPAVRNEWLAAEPASPTDGAELWMLHPGPLDYLEVLA